MARGVWIFAVCLLIAGLSQSNAEEQQLAPLKRSVRSAMQGLSAAMFEKETIEQAKECLKNKKLFVTPKAEFLGHIDTCSEDAVRKVRNCMPDDKKYFPEFIQDLMKSVVTMMYDDYDIMRVDLAACAPNLAKTSAQQEYINCVKRSSKEGIGEDCIPGTKAAFCKIFLPATECLVKWLESACDDSENLRKYRADYYAANAKPCEDKEEDNNMEYINCLKKVSQETDDDSGIPSSRASFCKKYLPATECFVKWVKSSCNDSENLRKFRADYYAASERPCEAKEVNTV
nr:unnamed protein product [Callosobruchus chinensis]